MNVNKVPSSSSCEPESLLLEKLRLISAGNQENIKTLNHVPKIRICTCDDSIESDNIFLVPRRTKEMLQSPLHRDMRAAYMGIANESKKVYSEPRHFKGTQAPQGDSLNLHSKKTEESENICLEPRRIKELLQSPIHRDMRAAYMGFANESKKVYSEPRRVARAQALQGDSLNLHSKKTEESENICLEPRRIKDLLQSPIHRDMRAAYMGIANESKKVYSEPRRTKGIMKPALHKQAPQGESLNLHSKKSEESENICLEPRRTKDLLMSPIHRDMRTIYMGIANESKKVYSEPRRTKGIMKPALHKQASQGDSLNVHSKKTEESENICSEPRRIKELLQSPIHKDMLPKGSSQNVRRQLQFEKQARNIKLDRIANYLQQKSEFQGISQRNIQQMGLQDFINIIGHLLANTGIPLKPLDKSNYIEQTIYAMKQLNYAHKVRKSWLQCPNASLQHIVQMLDFLMDLLPMD
ncbi:hypothetical protein ACLKA6_009487 [Drosophila palustris]